MLMPLLPGEPKLSPLSFRTTRPKTGDSNLEGSTDVMASIIRNPFQALQPAEHWPRPEHRAGLFPAKDPL